MLKRKLAELAVGVAALALAGVLGLLTRWH
jgi:hypothetical protein